MSRMLAPLVVMALHRRRKLFRGEPLAHKSQLKLMPEQCADRDRVSKVNIMCVQKGFVNVRLYVERPTAYGVAIDARGRRRHYREIAALAAGAVPKLRS